MIDFTEFQLTEAYLISLHLDYNWHDAHFLDKMYNYVQYVHELWDNHAKTCNLFVILNLSFIAHHKS